MKHIVAIVLALSLSQTAHAILVDGLTLRELALAQFSGSTSLSITTDSSGDVWYSNAIALFTVDENGQGTQVEDLRQAGGGPLDNNSASTDIPFDADNAVYVVDHSQGKVYKRESGSLQWTQFAAGIPTPKAMLLDPVNGDLIVGAGDISSPGQSALYRVTPDGEVSLFVAGLSGIEAMAFDADNNIVLVDYLTGLASTITLAGEVTELGYANSGGGLVESFLVTPEGYILLGINAGANHGDNLGNRNRLERYDPATNQTIVLGVDFTGIGNVGYRLPSDMAFHPLTGELLIAGYGSVLPLAIVGNVDADFGGGLQGGVGNTPEPATAATVAGGLMLLAMRRRRVRSDK